ncbi:MAG: hypothetical protein JW809_11140 [Pirellulales bacterium]|nr:hypothetical protein [Pirellulales bacterium]
MTEQFIGEPIQPVGATLDAARMSRGEPGLPRQFRWKSETIEIARVLRVWRETGPCRHGSGEAYVRKHWFEVLTAAGARMTLYFERQPRGGKTRQRWWLFTVEEPSPGETGTTAHESTAADNNSTKQQ